MSYTVGPQSHFDSNLHGRRAIIGEKDTDAQPLPGPRALDVRPAEVLEMRRLWEHYHDRIAQLRPAAASVS